MVIDCSVTMTWLFEDEADFVADEVLERLATGEATVPSIWPLEVANSLLVAERRKRATQAEVEHFIIMLSDLPIVIDNEASSRAFESILALARQENLTSYDATYLELALRQRLTLATLDNQLGRAAKNVGVHVLSR